MVIVKSKIDFATSMRRIFQSMAGKIFDFQCKRQRKVVKNFHCNQYISFCRKKEEDCEKRTVWKTKGKFSSFQEMGLPGRLWISDASCQSFLPARSIQGSFIFAVKSLQRNPWICTFLPCQNVVAPARMLYCATLRGMPLTEKQFMRAGCPMRIRPSKHPTIMALSKSCDFENSFV